MEKLLTIAIPTYNRADILNKNLNKIFEKNNLDINVLVCDNSSTDNTSLVCSTFVNNYPNFYYHRQTANLGYDLNVISCLDRGESEYVWFLSDDDFINSNLIIDVIDAIRKKLPTALLINAVVKNPSDGSVLIENLGNCFEKLEVLGDDYTFVKYSKWSTLISSIIIKKSEVDRGLIEKYVGSCFVQLSIFWPTVRNKKIYILGDVKIEKNDSHQADFALNSSEIWLDSWTKVIESFKQVYSHQACKNAATTLYDPVWYRPGSLLAHIILGKKRGTITKANYKEILNRVKINKLYRFMLTLVALTNNHLFEKSFAFLQNAKNKLN